MTRAILDNKWTMVCALMFAMLMQPLTPFIRSYYQTLMPVVDMRGTVIEQTDTSVLIHITGKKIRACEFMRLSGFTANAVGELRDAYLERVGGKPQDGATKPVGVHDLGFWRVWPTTDSTRASVFVQHDCDGELVLSKLADVDLKDTK